MFTGENKIFILVMVVVLFWGGVAGWFAFQKNKVPEQEIYTLSAVVSSVNAENHFLTVTPQGKENQIKIVISDATKLVKLETPFDADNPPAPGTQFTPTQTEVTLADFKVGDEILIKSSQNIFDKTTIIDVEFINILP